MKNHCLRFWKYCATFGPVGYFPAPGTVATLLMLPLVWFIRNHLIAEWHYGILIILIAVFSFICIDHAQKAFPGKSDPSSIVLDESLGTFITFIAVPITIKWFVIGFMLFRFFDIFKIFGISKCEKVPGALGIILDDVVAALCANILLCFMI